MEGTAKFMEPYRRLMGADHVHTYNSINENLSVPNSQFKRRFRCTRTLVLGVIFLVVIMTVTITIISTRITAERSILKKYHVSTIEIIRPQWWTDALRRAKIIEQRGAFSIIMPSRTQTNGTDVMWVFKETILNTSNQHLPWKSISNTALKIHFDVQGIPSHAEYIRDSEGFASPLVDNQANENSSVGIWPKAGIVTNTSNFMFWEVIKWTDIWRYEVYANGRGVSTQDLDGFPTNFTRLYDDDTKDSATIEYALIGEDSHIYLYMLRGLQFPDVLVARTGLDHINDSSPYYTFWTGDYDSQDAFTSDVRSSFNNAKPTISNYKGNQISVHYNAFLDQYCLLSGGETISIYTSKNPWGPWSQPEDIYTFPSTLKGLGVIDSAQFHPELWRDDGKVMIFSYGTTGGGDGLPYLVQIELS